MEQTIHKEQNANERWVAAAHGNERPSLRWGGNYGGRSPKLQGPV